MWVRFRIVITLFGISRGEGLSLRMAKCIAFIERGGIRGEKRG